MGRLFFPITKTQKNMRELILGVAIMVVLVACSTPVPPVPPVPPVERNPSKVVTKDGLAVGVYSFDKLKPFMEATNDSIYVVNFWATWCGPCVKELPYFEQLQENYKDKNVRVILVSLDFLDKIETKLIPFMQKEQLKSEVLVLDQKGMNEWISQIDSTWEGDLPATLIYRGDQRVFDAKSYDYEELEAELKPFL